MEDFSFFPRSLFVGNTSLQYADSPFVIIKKGM